MSYLYVSVVILDVANKHIVDPLCNVYLMISVLTLYSTAWIGMIVLIYKFNEVIFQLLGPSGGNGGQGKLAYESVEGPSWHRNGVLWACDPPLFVVWETVSATVAVLNLGTSAGCSFEVGRI